MEKKPSKKKYHQPLTPWERIKAVLCFCCLRRQNRRSYNKKRREKKRKDKQKQKLISGFVKNDSFYEKYDFQNRGLRKNWSSF